MTAYISQSIPDSEIASKQSVGVQCRVVSAPEPFVTENSLEQAPLSDPSGTDGGACSYDPDIEAFAEAWMEAENEAARIRDEIEEREALDEYLEQKARDYENLVPEPETGPKTAKTYDFTGNGPGGLSNGHNFSQRRKRILESAENELNPEYKIEAHPDGSIIKLTQKGTTKGCGGNRGNVVGFSSRSRRRMIEKLAMVRRDEAVLPFFVTCTFPDRVPEPEDCKRAWYNLGLKLLRAFPGFGDCWKRELVDRKSGEMIGEIIPHYHSMMWGLPLKFAPMEMRGKWAKVFKRGDCWIEQIFCLEDGKRVLKIEAEIHGDDLIYKWMARNWYECVGSGDIKAYQAGSAVEPVRSAGGVRSYCSKYMSKENQDMASLYCSGRYWGFRNSKNIPWADRVVVYLSPPMWNRAKRIFRTWFCKKTGLDFKYASKMYLQNPDVLIEKLIEYFDPGPDPNQPF